MKQLILKFILALAFGLGLTLTLLGLMTYLSLGLSVAHAADRTVCQVGPPTCTYTNVQAAVDAAASGDVIKVAAETYTGVSARAGITQMVYISKSVTIRGGYTNAFTEPPNSQANPTTLDAQGQGRVLFITGNISPTIEGLRITGGNAIMGGMGYDGGGVFVSQAAATLNNNQIFGNTAPNNLGLSFGGGVFLGLDSSMLNRNVISGNYAGHGGGGLVLVDSKATLNGNIITSNDACIGGGLDILYSDGVMINNNIITDNAAPPLCFGTLGSAGGGVTIDLNSDVTLVNNLIADNQAMGQGSGLYIRTSSARLLHTTIAHNTGGDGSGIYVAVKDGTGEISNSIVALTNTILVSQTVGVTVTVGSTVTFESTLWNSNTINWGGAGTINASNDYTGNPAFVNPNSGNYHLGPASAAIDKGVNAGVMSDIDGESRPQGMAPDLGADESPYPLAEMKQIFLPVILKQ